MRDSKIQWTDHTFNPWWGCQRVSPGCTHCYAEAFAKRTGHKVWGPEQTTPRRFFGEKHWSQPLKWAREAWNAGERRRVFCASMADVFEDRADLEAERQKLWTLIRATFAPCAHPAHDDDCRCGHGPVGTEWRCGAPGLDWLLLTKRPENIQRLAPADILPLVWVGTTVEDQQRADERIPELLKVPARVRFLSCEPLLGPVGVSSWMWPVHWHWDSRFKSPEEAKAAGAFAEQRPQSLVAAGCRFIDWVIVGGESGQGARPFDLAWARSIRDQCKAAGVPFFLKQLGARALMGRQDECAPEVPAMQRDRKGGDPSEWPEDLRVREFPEVRHA